MSNFEILAGSHGRFLSYSPDLVTDQIRQFGAHTRPEIAFLASAVQAGDKIIDAGAHIGTFAVPLAKAAGATGRVLAIEANDLTYAALKINVSLNQLSNRIKCVNAAIGPKGESRGPMVMAPGNTMAAAFEPGGCGVLFQPLSEIMRNHDFPSADVIKMDVEGMEFYIFSDLSRVLKQTRPVVYFGLSRRLIVNGVQHTRLNAMLQDFGYRLFKNVGDRNAKHDRFTASELPALPQFSEVGDVLCLHRDSSRISQVLGASHQSARAEADDRNLLDALMTLSREQIGFFPATATRTIEYPWFASRLAGCAGQTVIDVGAGVCVLPFWLARQDCRVVTLDSHPTVRDPRDRSGWNEWGFLDYGRLDPRIVSHQIDAAAFEPPTPAAAVYSVSVLEHMPAAVRRALIARIPGWLAPGGRVYLSFDLVVGADDLWPLSEGRTVDPAGSHGMFADVLHECRAAGLQIIDTSIARGIPGSRTDVAFLEALRPQM